MKDLESTSMPLGVDEFMVVPSAPAVDLEAGDIIVLPTDGIEETASPGGELFGRERTLDVVDATAISPPLTLSRRCIAPHAILRMAHRNRTTLRSSWSRFCGNRDNQRAWWPMSQVDAKHSDHGRRAALTRSIQPISEKPDYSLAFPGQTPRMNPVVRRRMQRRRICSLSLVG